MSYTEAKSEFVKNLIRGASWSDKTRRKCIDDLLIIERYVLTGPSGFADALRSGMLKEKYKPEAMLIFKELKPKEYDKFTMEAKKECKKSIKEAERLAKEHKIEEEHKKKEWLKMGGTE
jgi:hypothetical protein